MAVIALLGAVLVAFVVPVGLLTPVQGAILWNEAGKAAITALGIAVVGGFVKLLFDQHMREREERERRDRFVESLIVDLDNLRATVQRAQLLLRAHLSAESYGKQMDEPIGARVRTTGLERTVHARWGRDEDNDMAEARDMVVGHLDQLKKYLDAVLAEYGESYETVSRLESLHEEVTPSTFPQLWDFLSEAEGSRYGKDIVPGWREATGTLFHVLWTRS